MGNNTTGNELSGAPYMHQGNEKLTENFDWEILLHTWGHETGSWVNRVGLRQGPTVDFDKRGNELPGSIKDNFLMSWVTTKFQGRSCAPKLVNYL